MKKHSMILKDSEPEKSKTDLVKKVSKIEHGLSKKENRLFKKILFKGLENWNQNDREFLELVIDLHTYTFTSIGGLDIYPAEQLDDIRKKEERNRMNAVARLKEEPFSSWIQNLRTYK